MRGRRTGIGRTALQLANRVAHPLDRLAASSASGSTSPIMIVGLPRSGTTLMYELLVQAFDVSFLTRTYSYAYGLPNILTRIVAGGIRNPDAQYLSNYGRIPGRFAPAENAVFWDRWFPEDQHLGHHVPRQSVSTHAMEEATATLSSMSAITGRPFVFKNVYMTLSLAAFFTLLPNSKAIIVTRNTDEVVASVYNKRKSIASWWTIRPPFADDVLRKSVLEQTAFQCIRGQQLLEHSLATLPDERYKVVDYAAFCEDPRSVIAEIKTWAGGDVARRHGQEIPERFERSAGPGLTDEAAAEFADYAASLNESSSEYLARIRAFVAERSENVAS